VLAVVTPLCLLPHNYIFENTFGWCFPVSLNNEWADLLTLILIGCGALVFIRSMIRSDIQKSKFVRNPLLLFLMMGSLVTGFLAHHQLVGFYRSVLVFHILLGELLLVSISLFFLNQGLLVYFKRAKSQRGVNQERAW
jgi:hypothetical protein